MPRVFACFGGCSGGLVPPDHTELSRVELKALYDACLAANNGRLIVHGIFARANTKNNNKRVYPKNILKREVAKFEQLRILTGTALGELDHPNYASQYFKCLNLPNVSHQVLEVHWQGDLLWGTIEILPTPSGLLLWELYSQGIKLGVSSRGWASLRTDPKAMVVYVDDDFELITFDFVTEPSTCGAFLVPVCRAYRACVPDQSKTVQISHLGHGVVSMNLIPKLPDVTALAQRINELQAQQGVDGSMGVQAGAGLALRAPAAAAVAVGEGARPRGHLLDKLLCHSHYVVYNKAAYLHREPHARDFAAHLTMFATRAHLADQQPYLSWSHLNSLIMREMAKDEEAERLQQAAASAAGAGGFKGVGSVHQLTDASSSPAESPLFSGTNSRMAAKYIHNSQSIGALQPDSSNDLSTTSMPANLQQKQLQHIAASDREGEPGTWGLSQSDSAECQSALPGTEPATWHTHASSQDPKTQKQSGDADNAQAHSLPSSRPASSGFRGRNQVHPAPPAPAPPTGYNATGGGGGGSPGPNRSYQPAPAQPAAGAPPAPPASGFPSPQQGSGQKPYAVVGRPGVGYAAAQRAAHEVAAEFPRIKKTLAAFGEAYAAQQRNMVKSCRARLPLTTEDGAPVFSFRGARL